MKRSTYLFIICCWAMVPSAGAEETQAANGLTAMTREYGGVVTAWQEDAQGRIQGKATKTDTATGIVILEADYVDDVLHGTRITRSKSGPSKGGKIFETEYRFGMKHGTEKQHAAIYASSLSLKVALRDRVVVESTHVFGKEHGTRIEYHYRDGDGKGTDVLRPRYRVPYKFGMRHGTAEWLDFDGQVTKSASYLCGGRKV